MKQKAYIFLSVMVFLHCTGPGMGPGTRTGSMCSNILCRNVHIAVADPRGAPGKHAPSRSEIFHFHQRTYIRSLFSCSFRQKICKIIVFFFAPFWGVGTPWKILDPPPHWSETATGIRSHSMFPIVPVPFPVPVPVQCSMNKP